MCASKQSVCECKDGDDLAYNVCAWRLGVEEGPRVCKEGMLSIDFAEGKLDSARRVYLSRNLCLLLESLCL